MIALVNGTITAANMGLSVLLHHLLVGPSGLRSLETPIVLLLMSASIPASLAITPAQLVLGLGDTARRNFELARSGGIDLERADWPVGGRLAMAALGLTLTPVLVLISAALTLKGDATYERAMRQAQTLSTEVMLLPPDQPLGRTRDVVDNDRAVPFVLEGGKVRVPESASLPAWATPATLTGAVGGRSPSLDHRVVLSARRLDDGRIVGAVVPMEPLDREFVFLLVSVLVLLGSFGPVAASMFARSLSGPLQEMSKFARRIVEQGDLSEMGHLSAGMRDEVGVVTEHLNELLDSLRSLASAAQEVGRGKLVVEIGGRGELPDSFRSMLNQLRGLVGEMHSSSRELATAATEISAASQEQEAATTSHSAGMTEIAQTMDSLSDSASHVARSVQGVLENAERTLQNTDQMVARIDDLTGHANRIGDILEVIKEIANRTDLLALNGSLEASRAGEAGVGFSLVAGEMRRLAERVTGSTNDIKQLVSDIRESGASTVVATEESRKLAEGTTEAARSITLVTQQQQSSTEQVSQNVRSVAEVVQQAAASTAQTRASAEGLKEQADRLAELVARFEVA